MKKLTFALLLIVFMTGCSKPLSEKMADQLVKGERPQEWSRDVSMELSAILATYESSKKSRYLDYVYECMDNLVSEEGSIAGCASGDKDMKAMSAGCILLDLNRIKPTPKFKLAADSLYARLLRHPRTPDGAFVADLSRPALYLCEDLYDFGPFFMQYVTETFEGEELEQRLNDVLLNFSDYYGFFFDPVSSLARHAVDAFGQYDWSNKNNGQSPVCWGRGQGYLLMAFAKAAPYIPKDLDPDNRKVLMFVNGIDNIIYSLNIYADGSGFTFQVVEKNDLAGNYREATSNIMQIYTLLRAIRCGYEDGYILDSALKTYREFNRNFVIKEKNGLLTIVNCSSDANLLDPECKADAEYYLSLDRVENGRSAMASYVLASLEYEQLLKDVEKIKEIREKEESEYNKLNDK